MFMDKESQTVEPATAAGWGFGGASENQRLWEFVWDLTGSVL